MNLVFLHPSEELLPSLAAYRRASLEAGDDLDGTAGLGAFPSPADWLERVELLASPAAERRGWYRTAVFLAFRRPGECSLAAREAADPDRISEILGIGNVRFPHSGEEEDALARSAGNIGYHVRPDLRRRGIGTAILGEAVRICLRNGLPRPTVSVRADNLPSLRTALAFGFREESRGVLPTGEPFVRLRFTPDL